MSETQDAHTGKAKTRLDIAYVRKQFPALTEGRYADIAFFENAGGTYVPQQVIASLNDFLIHSKVQPYARYAMSQEATAAIESATVSMAEWINVDPSDVVIGHSTTMNLVMLAKALRPWFRPYDEVIVTNQDHESNITPWRRLARCGAVIKEWRMRPETGELHIEDLIPLLSEATRLVCMPHSSNIVGSVNPVAHVANLVHECDAMLMVDGVSYAPHHALDMQALGVDFYSLSLYKVFGPHLGLLYVNQQHHDKLQNQSLDFMPELYAGMHQAGAPNYLRIALNPGLANHESVACLNGLVTYFDQLYSHHFSDPTHSGLKRRLDAVFDLIHQHESELAEAVLTIMQRCEALELIGQSAHDTSVRSPTFSFRLRPTTNAITLDHINTVFTENQIAVQKGCFYAWRCLEGLGIDPAEGVLRISLAHFNDVQEVQKLAQCIEVLNQHSG